MSVQCVHQGSLCLRVGSKIILPGLNEWKALPACIHSGGDTVTSTQSFADSEPDHAEQTLYIFLRALLRQGGRLQEMVCGCVSHVSHSPVLCICANQFTFPDPMLALYIHILPFLFFFLFFCRTVCHEGPRTRYRQCLMTSKPDCAKWWPQRCSQERRHCLLAGVNFEREDTASPSHPYASPKQRYLCQTT